MFFQSPITPFWLYISVALWAGIFVSSQFVFHQLWQFIAPGLPGAGNLLVFNNGQERAAEPFS